jgi:hypothetical protein
MDVIFGFLDPRTEGNSVTFWCSGRFICIYTMESILACMGTGICTLESIYGVWIDYIVIIAFDACDVIDFLQAHLVLWY